MEDDIDIYADLPSFNLNLDKNDQLCNCEKLKKELGSLKSKFENIQKIKEKLEKNLFSLLKTARAEIARKDKMISDLRKRLDDATFRRNNKGESWDFSAHRSLYQQHTMIERYDNAPLMHLQEDETILHKTEFHRNEHKNKKPQYDGQLPTVFAERLHKRITKDEKEDAKSQRNSLKLDVEANSKGISEENIVESDKENGSQSNINNNDNESNTITRHSLSDSENPCRKNSGKRMNEEDGTCGNKRLKIDDDESKIATDEIDYDCTVRYELKDNVAQYEMKDNFAKFEDRLNAVHPLKEAKILLDERRAASEHQDMAKQSRDYINGWKREEKSNSRIASNRVLDEPSGYKKSGYIYNLSRSYSRNRSDYDSSSSHRLRERSNRMYRNNRKYDDYKYDNQYRTKRDYRLKRNYESMENESKTIHKNREHDDVAWDKSKHSSSDVEDKERNSSYKNKRYENRRIKETAANILHNKGLHESDKAAADINFRTSSGRTLNNTVNHRAKKITEQDKTKNESNIKFINSTEVSSTSTCVEMKDSNNLEEGEIVDSPEKKIDSAKISKDHKMIENNVKIVLIENKHKDVPMIASVIDDKSIPFDNDVITAKQLDNVMDISSKGVETLHLVQTTLKDSREVAELNFSGENAVIDEVRNRNNDEHIYKSQCNEDLTVSTTCIIGTIEQVCESQYNEDLTDLTTYTIGTINQMCDSNVDNDDKSRAEEEPKICVTETAIKIEKMIDSNTKSAPEVRIDVPKIENVINKDKVSNCNIESSITIAKTNNSDNGTCKIDDKLKSSATEIAEKIETMLNYDIENRDVNQISIGNEISRWTSSKSNIEMSSHLCLNDHNYVQNPPLVNASGLNAIRESPVSSQYCETMLEAATLKETKAKEKMDISLTVDVKKTMSSIVKNKKNQQSKGVVILRRRRAVMLSDSNASMTVLINTKTSSNINSNCNNESALKPRACKASRACK
ncbi:hypothetical protein ACFW04_007465 [Cataglyphis niger]